MGDQGVGTLRGCLFFLSKFTASAGFSLVAAAAVAARNGRGCLLDFYNYRFKIPSSRPPMLFTIMKPIKSEREVFYRPKQMRYKNYFNEYINDFANKTLTGLRRPNIEILGLAMRSTTVFYTLGSRKPNENPSLRSKVGGCPLSRIAGQKGKTYKVGNFQNEGCLLRERRKKALSRNGILWCAFFLLLRRRQPSF